MKKYLIGYREYPEGLWNEEDPEVNKNMSTEVQDLYKSFDDSVFVAVTEPIEDLEYLQKILSQYQKERLEAIKKNDEVLEYNRNVEGTYNAARAKNQAEAVELFLSEARPLVNSYLNTLSKEVLDELSTYALKNNTNVVDMFCRNYSYELGTLKINKEVLKFRGEIFKIICDKYDLTHRLPYSSTSFTIDYDRKHNSYSEFKYKQLEDINKNLIIVENYLTPPADIQFTTQY